MKTTDLLLKTALLSSLLYGVGCGAQGADDGVLEGRQALIDTENGLKTINGLTTKNGLKTINGLSTKNGLKSINGLMSINGLKTVNGLRTVNGLSVDCSTGTAGVDCTGAPDGLLSAATGLLSSDAGIMVAKYLVRCALPATDAVTVKDYTGAVIELPGEIGFAPEWAEGNCNSVCEEKVSACLMALTNSAGNHVSVELSAQFTIGSGSSADHPYQEASFYGNLFASPPTAYFAEGKDFAGTVIGAIVQGSVANRVCGGWTLFGNTCPYVDVGVMAPAASDPLRIVSSKCTTSGGAAVKCVDKGNLNNKTWSYPITTYRMTKGAT